MTVWGPKQECLRGSITALGKMVVPDYAERLAWYHERKAAVLQEVIKYARFRGERGGVARALFSEPPQHGKSLHCSELAPASILGLDPKMRVMIAAYGGDLAKRGVENTKRWMSHPDYLSTYSTRIYSTASGPRDSVRDQAAMFQTLDRHGKSAGGYYRAVGMDGSATGWGYNLGIIDDLVKNAEQARSPAYRRKCQRFYTSSFATRRQGPAGMVAVGTMWGRPDILDWLYALWRAEGHEPVWLRFPALYDPELPYTDAEDPRKLDEGLWDFIGDDEYKRTRAGLLASDPGAWHALYQQNPQGESGAIFKPDQWRWYDSSYNLDNLQEIHFSFDPNVKSSGKSFGVGGVYGVVDSPRQGTGTLGDYGTAYFRLDEARGHWDYTTLRSEALRLILKWQRELPGAFEHPRSKIWIESKANGPALHAELVESHPEFSHMLELVPKMRNKQSCYRTAAPVVREQRVWLPSESFGPVTADWAKGDKGFVDELEAQQPVHEPNDRADEFAQMIICRDPGLGPEMLGALA